MPSRNAYCWPQEHLSIVLFKGFPSDRGAVEAEAASEGDPNQEPGGVNFEFWVGGF